MRHLAWLSVFCAACSAPATSRQFEVNQLVMPRTFDQFRWDFNGDGHRENQLAGVLSVLLNNGIDPQESVDQAIASGSFRPTIEVFSDGAATFGDGAFRGELRDGFYQAIDGDTRLSLALPFLGGAQVEVQHAVLQMEVGAHALTAGQLNATVPQSEIDAKIMPGVALVMNAKIDGDPSSPFSQWLLQLFDDGGVDGCGIKNDRHIQGCEVATNGVMKNMFKPDVDGWSLGVGFGAIELR